MSFAPITGSSDDFFAIAGRIDAFTETLPAFKALGLVMGAADVIREALDMASEERDPDRRALCITVAARAADRLAQSTASLKALLQEKGS